MRLDYYDHNSSITLLTNTLFTLKGTKFDHLIARFP